MEIVNHKLKGVRYRQARRMGGNINPQLAVLHETAGRLTKFSSVHWFQSPKARSSAHATIERDGTITQQVPFNRKAWHAGKSAWNGRRYCNGFSIGIELVGPGKLDKAGKAWFGERFEEAVTATSPHHGTGRWLKFTPEQMEACRTLCIALMEEYEDLNDIATHWEISPGRKVDPNPLFPLETFKRSVMDPSFSDDFGRVEPSSATLPAANDIQDDIASEPALKPGNDIMDDVDAPVLDPAPPVKEAARKSNTILGALMALFATIVQFFEDAAQVLIEAASKITELGPAQTVLGHLGLNVNAYAFGFAVFGIALVIFRRLDAAHKGKIG